MVESNSETSTSPQVSEETNIDVNNEIPLDDYYLVGWDLDVTGRKLLDEICHIAGYTPDDSFSLYIMPHGDLNSVAKKRHNIRIVTVHYYRIIKDMTSNKMVKTKSEISALQDFLEWLEVSCKKSNKKGVLLMCHESYKFNPHLLIKSLLKYDLLERFSNIVKGFVDCHTFAKKKCEETMVFFSMRILAKVLLNKENVEIFKASDRSRLTYDIVQHLCAGASEIGSGAASPNTEIVRTVLPFTTSVASELKVLEDLQVVLSRQNTLKPIFAQFLGYKWMSYHERRNGLQLRKYLVDAFVDYDMLKTAWSKGKEALEELINDKLSSDEVSNKHREDLVKLLVDHFEKPEEIKPRKGGRVPKKSSKKSSPSSTKSESKDSPASSPVTESGSGEAPVNTEPTITVDIITPMPTNPNPVEVN